MDQFIKKNDLNKGEANIIDLTFKEEAERFPREIINYALVLVLIVHIHKFVTALTKNSSSCEHFVLIIIIVLSQCIALIILLRNCSRIFYPTKNYSSMTKRSYLSTGIQCTYFGTQRAFGSIV